MPVVQIDIFEGRSVEQKRNLAKAVTKAIADSINCPPEAVTIIIREMKRENYAKAGELYVDKK